METQRAQSLMFLLCSLACKYTIKSIYPCALFRKSFYIVALEIPCQLCKHVKIRAKLFAGNAGINASILCACRTDWKS